MKHNLVNRIIAVVLSVMMLPACSPMFVFAEDITSDTGKTETEAEAADSGEQTDGGQENAEKTAGEDEEKAVAKTNSSILQSNADLDDSKEVYTLTIYYYYETVGGVLAKSPYVGEYDEGDTYNVSIQTAGFEGYTPKINGEAATAVTGTISADTTVNVVYYGDTIDYTVKSKVENNDGTFTTNVADKTGKVGQATVAELDGNILSQGYHATEPNNVTLTYGSNINIDINYYLNSVKIIFDSQDGSYVPPVYGKYGDKISLSGYTPTRQGYAFAGWYKDADCTIPVDESAAVTADVTTYYAKWLQGQANYSVIYWTENADDNGYTYVKTVTGSGITGSTIPYDTDISGIDGDVFAYKDTDGDTVVNANSTAALNVRYSRNKVTVNFYQVKKKKWEIAYTYTGKKGASFIDSNGDNLWPTVSGQNWYTTKTDRTFQVAMLYYPTDKDELNFYGKSSGDYDYSTQYYVKDLNGDYVWHHTDKFSSGSNVSLTDEDCYEIRGFTYSYRRDYNDKRIAKIYYTRNNYSLEFYYKSTELKPSSSVPFEKLLSSYDFKPTNAQAGLPDYYEFEGWYTSKDCVDGSEYNLSTNTMPSNNLKLYAKFDIQEKTVNFETNGGTTIDSQNIKAGDTIDRPENPSLEGSEFVGWYKDESTTIPYDFSAPVMNDITLYAKWTKVTDTTYSIRYIDEGGEDVFPARENIAGTVGKEVNATALHSATLIPDAAFKTLVLSYDKTKNVITFTYSEASEQEYTIKYLKKSDNTKLAEPFTGTTMLNQISVTAKTINGYWPEKGTHLLSLSTGINEYAFLYTPIDYNINYNLDGGAVMGNPSSYTIEDEFTLVNPTKEGSVFTGWTGSNGETPNKSVNVSAGTTGTLTYTANWKEKTKIKLTAKSQTKTYDGEELTNSGYNLDGTLEDGDTLDVDVNGSITDVGETSNEIMSYTVKDSDGNDVTGNYSISTETGTLKVNKADITVTAASKSKEYDGIELTDDAFKTTGNLVTGQNVDATVKGSIKDAGTEANVISAIKVKAADGTTDVTSNYSITPKNGTLTITKASNPDVTFTAAGYTGTYDAAPHPATATLTGPDAEQFTLKYSTDGGTTWSDTAPSITDAGSKDVSVKAVSNNFTDLAKKDVTLKVNKADITVTAASKSKEYDGIELTDDTFKTTGNLVTGQNVDATVKGSIKDAGTEANVISAIKVKAADGTTDVTSNYSITPKNGTLTITKASNPDVTFTAAGYTGTYDAAPHPATATLTGPDAEQFTLKYSTDGGTTWSDTAPSITDAGSKDVSVKAVSNNFTDLAKKDVTLKVNKADITVTAASKSKEYDGIELTDDTFKTTGNLVTGQNVDATVKGSIKDAGTEANVISAIKVKAADGTTDVTSNYSITPKNGTLTITKASNPDVTFTAAGYTGTYDAAPHPATATLTGPDAEQFTLKYSTDGGTTWSDTAPSITDAGSKDVSVKAVSNNFTDLAKKDVTLKVNKADITVTAASKSKEYDGIELTDDTFKTTGNLVTGQNVDATVKGSIKDAGTEANVISAIKVKAADGTTDVTSNYSITPKNGTLTITKASNPDVTFTAAGYTGTYDAAPHPATATLTGPDAEQFTLKYSTDGGTTWSDTAPSITDAGSKDVSVKAVSNNFTDLAKKDVTLKVNKADITVTAASKSKEYDGIELTDDTFKTTGNLVTGQNVDATVKGSIKDAGTEANVISAIKVKAADGTTDVTSNYSITPKNGTLTITKASNPDVTFTAAGYTGTYDAAPHPATATLTGPDAEQFTLKYSTDGGTTWSDTAPSITDAGSKDVSVKAVSNNFTDLAKKDVTLKVNKADITVTAASKSKEYDGIELTDDTFKTTGNLVTGQNVDATVKGSIKDAGTEANVISAIKVKAADGTTDVTSNYSITPKNGTLTITKASNPDVTFTAAGYTGTYDAAPHPATATLTGPDAEQFTLKYSTDGGTTWSDTAPSITDAGSKDVSVKAVSNNFTDLAKKDVTLKVNKADITVTAASKSKEYDGIELTDDTFKTTGNLVTGQNVDATVKGSIKDAGTEANVISAIKVKAADGTTDVTSNYSITPKNGTLTITKASNPDVTFTAAGYTGTYDAAPHPATATLTGPDAEQFTLKYSTDGGTTWSDTAPSITDAGSKDVSVKAVSNNFTDLAKKDVTLKVNKADITVTAASKSKEYDGIELTDDTFKTTGNLVTGQNVDATVKGSIKDAGTEANVISAIKVKAADGTTDVTSNYSITPKNGTLTITKASNPDVTFTAAGYTGTYDAAPHPATATLTGPDAEQFTLKYSTDGGTTWSDTAPSITDAGSKDVSVKAVSNNFTDLAKKDVTLKVNKADITVTAASKSKEYDGIELTDDTFKTTGNLVTGQNVDATVKGSIKDAGTEANVISAIKVKAADGTTDVTSNYSITPKNGTLTITKASNPDVTFTAAGYTGTYDAAPHPATATLTGPDAEQFTLKYSTDGGTTWSDTAPSITDAGSKDVSVKAVSNNFTDLAKKDVTLKVNRANVTITVNNSSKTFGDTDPEFTGAVNGLVLGGSPLSVSFFRDNAGIDTVGTYEKVLSANFRDIDGNYNVTINRGDFTITKADVAATLTTTGYTGIYDGVEHPVNASLSGDKADDYTIEYKVGTESWTTDLPNIVDVGTETVSIRAINISGQYEDIDAQNVELAVTPKAVTITANNNSKTIGTGDPELTGTVGGLVKEADLGIVSYTREAGETVGTYTITALYTDNGNYDVTVNNGTFTINAAVVPIVPVTPITPAIVIPAAGVVTATIVPAAVPQAAAAEDTETISKDKAAKTDLNQWALINLLCAILTVIVLAGLAASDKKKNEYLNPDDLNSEKKTRKKFKVGFLVEAVITIGSVIAFILTENMNYDMALTDKWTLLMVILAGLSLVAYIAVGKRDDTDSKEPETAK